MSNVKILIMGRSGSGKSALAYHLAKVLPADPGPVSILDTGLDRPMAHPDAKPSVFHPIVPDYPRQVSEDALSSADITILHPAVSETAIRFWKTRGNQVILVYMAANRENRLSHVLARERQEAANTARTAFYAREQREDPAFAQCEAKLSNGIRHGATDLIIFKNDFTVQSMEAVAKRIMAAAESIRQSPRTMQDTMVIRAPGNILALRQNYSAEGWTAICRMLGLDPAITRYISIAPPEITIQVEET